MIRVLIIDDEEPSREAIRILGEWSRYGVVDVLEAANGLDALELVRELLPDLIFVDMKMPEMNGVEFLQAVQLIHPEAQTVVISGFDDFEYTRQAIKSRVVDYLLKPVNRLALNQALAKAVEGLRERKRQRSDDIERGIALNMSLPKLKETIFLSILEQKGIDRVPASQLKLIGAEDPGKSFGIAVVRVLNFEAVRKGRFKQDTGLLHFALSNLVNEIGAEAFHCFSFGNPKRAGEIIVVLGFERMQPGDIERSSAYYLEKAARKLRELFGAKCIVGIGGIHAPVSLLADSYRSAVEMVEAVNLLGFREGKVLQEKPAGAAGTPSVMGRIMQLRSALQADDPGLAAGIVNDYVHAIRKSQCLSLGAAYRVLQEFWMLMHDIALEFGVPAGLLARECRDTLQQGDLLYDIAEFDDFERLLHHTADYFCGVLRSTVKRSGTFRVSDIRDYIRSHFHEEIKISMFTEKYYLSREYLMRLFKQEYGVGIYEYVLRLRMEKAKELLADPRLKIQNISDMLGYKDKNYFSKAFKTYYGHSPSEFRQANQVQEEG
jgi:two-component system, response regulator YesN